ncbi:MAG TPA: hypothetical protein ACQGQH_01585 [Xylella sp.]
MRDGNTRMCGIFFDTDVSLSVRDCHQIWQPVRQGDTLSHKLMRDNARFKISKKSTSVLEDIRDHQPNQQWSF